MSLLLDEKTMEKEMQIETRTIEELLQDLRKEKSWTYINIVERLNTLGLLVDEKKVKKWEIGLEYPDLDTIYKLSELYYVPSENFIIAKNNSYQRGLESVHMMLIKWICYFTGISLKMALVSTYIFIGGALVWAFLFFLEKVSPYRH